MTVTLGALLLCIVGWLLVRRAARAGGAGRTRMWQVAAGGAALTAALPPCLAHWGATVGLTLWLAILSVAALIVVGITPFVGRQEQPRRS